MGKPKSQSRQNYFVFLVAVVMSVCFLLGSLLFLYETKYQNEQESIQYLRDATRQRQMALDLQIEGNLQILRGVAIGLTEIDLRDKGLLFKLLDRVNRSNHFVRMGLADTGGIIDLVDLDGTVYPGIDLSTLAFFHAAMTDRYGVSGTFLSPATGLGVNYYAVPVYKGEEIIGVLCGVNTEEVIGYILHVPVFQGQGLFLVTDNEGGIISPGEIDAEIQYGTSVNRVLKFTDADWGALQQVMAAGDSGSFSAERAGESVIVTNQPLALTAWQMLSIVPRDGITAHYNRASVGIMVIILAACLLFVLLLLWQMRMMNRSKKSLEILAYTDMLTGVSNQAKFLMDAALLLKENGEKGYAVWSFDIKRFTDINYLFGVGTGDRMLRWIASALEKLTPKNSTFCRFSADLFVGLHSYREKEELCDWSAQLWAELAQQEIVPASKMRIDGTIGFYCIEDFSIEQADIIDMVNWASMARKKAKQTVGNEVLFFTREMRERTRWESELEVSSRAALSKGDITFFLQPKVNIQNGFVISGAEVLARWKHAVHDWIPPAEFVPLFESNGFIVELDRCIFDQACRWYVQARDRGIPAFQLAINVSRQGLLRADFLEYYVRVKQHYGIADNVLELEFTESVVLDDYDLFQCVVAKLQKGGFVCSIDDFGTGYSSLNVLKNLTIDVLKLDAVFLRDGIDTERERTVVSHFVHMARRLGIKTVAEGVETAQQVLFLQRTGCDTVQGYYFFKPIPLSDFEHLMMKTNGRLRHRL